MKSLFEKKNMKFMMNTSAVGASVVDNRVHLKIKTNNIESELQSDAVLVCVGRKPYTKGLGMEQAAIAMDKRGFIQA